MYLPLLLFIDFLVTAGLLFFFYVDPNSNVMAFNITGVSLSLFIQELSSGEDYLSKKTCLLIGYFFGYTYCTIMHYDQTHPHFDRNAYALLLILSYPICLAIRDALSYSTGKSRLPFKYKHISFSNRYKVGALSNSIYVVSILILIITMGVEYFCNVSYISLVGILLFIFLVGDMLNFNYFIFNRIMKNSLKTAAILGFAILSISCTTSRDVLYIQNAASGYSDTLPATKAIDTDDILSIKVIAADQEATKFYNLGISEFSGSQNQEMIKLTNYLVDSDGLIHFPFLGKIYVKDKTIKELESYLKNKLKTEGQLTDGDIIIRTVNSRFTVLGEVKNPGTFTFSESKLSLFQALGTAGDLTINASRKNLILIRKENDRKKIYKFDITSSTILESEISYIQKNDVIIVNPNKAKIKSAGLIGNPSVLLSAASLLLSAILLTK